ncbi:hypothetical protein [Cytobacillus firmus]|uniref:hypothetical protein n=1 Tax=Cytobacillus firmus TaxID=1399 RepID=UPI001C8DA0B9|nr:hypothetical protein [Cytobacillus firmus]MBX9974743.1 hypothetical protein [Cytobacillus firmus]
MFFRIPYFIFFSLNPLPIRLKPYGLYPYTKENKIRKNIKRKADGIKLIRIRILAFLLCTLVNHLKYMKTRIAASGRNR